MDIIFSNVAGLDIHKKTIVACVRVVDGNGRASDEVREFGTMTSELLKMSDWLSSCHVTHVAMESTGVFWKPVWNILEGVFELLLVNPRELKQVPGRKSDVKDAQWIAHLLQCGLLKSSFVPERPQRELRDLTRHRAQLTDEHTRIANRIHKILEDGNIKLGSVASDILGKSGRDMLRALIAGERDTDKLAEMARARMRSKIPELRLALEGHVTEHHVYMLSRLMRHLDYLEVEIEEFSRRIAERIVPFVDDDTMGRLCKVPGVDRLTVENVVAEIGVNMDQFPTAGHLSSWAGVSPGNEESAGKRKRRRTTPGNRWLCRALGEAAWGASRTKNTYLSAQYRRLTRRRGKKRAVVAVGHSLLVIFYHLLESPIEYHDLGGNHFDQLEPERLKRYLVRRLESLGYDVELTQHQEAA